MLGDPRSGSKVWKALDREIGEPGENLSQIVPHWEFQPAAAFHDRENRRDFGTRQWAADVYPVLPDYVHVCIIDLHLIWKPVEMRGCPAAIDT
jgi:hypothetical protein